MKEKAGCQAVTNSYHIDRESDQPVYLQVSESLSRQILAGVYRPGERLPSENRLVEMYGVSPMTVRRAINLLASQGTVSTIRGSGTYVKEVDIGAAFFFLQDIEELFNRDEGSSVKVLEARFCKADDKITHKLGVEKGERVVFIRRLLKVAREPAFYHQGYLVCDPHRPVIEAELNVTELKGLFQGGGNSLIKYGDLYLESVILEKEEADILETDTPSPGMKLEHIFYDFEDKPVSWGWFISTSAHLRLHTRVGLKELTGGRDERVQ